MTLAEMKAELSQAIAKRKEIAGTKSYNLQDSHSVENSTLKEMDEYIAGLERKILRYQGYIGRTIPDFGG